LTFRGYGLIELFDHGFSVQPEPVCPSKSLSLLEPHVAVMVAPPTADRREHDKRPFVAFPINAFPMRRTKAVFRPRPDGYGPPVFGIVLIEGERGFAEIKNEECRCDISYYQGNGHDQDHRQCPAHLQEAGP